MKRFLLDFFSISCRNLRQHREMGIFSIFSHNQATFSIHFADFESSLASYVSIFQPLIPDLHLPWQAGKLIRPRDASDQLCLVHGVGC